MRLVRLLICMIFVMCSSSAQETFFSKVIIWGHPLHSHTHSYIHEAFYRAFKHLGYEVYWVSTQDEIKNIDIHNALFLTEGQVDKEMPKREDCYYILHNWHPDDYRELFSQNRCILLQVYTDDCWPYVTEKLDDFIYSNAAAKIIFMPWATDLLPHEIDAIKNKKIIDVIKNKKTKEAKKIKRKKLKDQKLPTINWIGTIGEGRFGNNVEVEGFKKACSENNIAFNHIVNVSMKKNIGLIKESYMAPALQGPYQCEKGYIPCRIFKNISYGQWGITNNKAVHALFKGKVIYNADTYQLFYDAQAYIDKTPITELYKLMDLVKNKHTYINRIETLLTFIKKALNIKENDEV